MALYNRSQKGKGILGHSSKSDNGENIKKAKPKKAWKEVKSARESKI
jgi:hypothetical protein